MTEGGVGDTGINGAGCGIGLAGVVGGVISGEISKSAGIMCHSTTDIDA